MRRLAWAAVVILLLLVAVPAFAQEAAAQPAEESVMSQILQAVVAAGVAALSTVLTVLIKRWAAKVKAEENDSLKSQAKVALTRMAENIAEKELVALREVAKDGKIDKADLKRLGDQAIEGVKEEFRTQGIDVAKKLGQSFMESQLRNVVDKLVIRK